MHRLSQTQIRSFIENGFVKIENAFSVEIAEACNELIWASILPDRNRPDTWTQPVIWISELGQEPFNLAVNSILLTNAYRQLAGDNWLPRKTLGSFPIRFPGGAATNDTGWHVDASYPGDRPENYFDWKININSKGRALLMLFLFSNVSELDAPTRIKAGSHLDVARLLMPYGEAGLSFIQLAEKLDQLPDRETVMATGNAGTVYLCHPFLVHAAQQHKGTTPRFMAQPPLLSKTGFNIHQSIKMCPVEEAILYGIRQK